MEYEIVFLGGGPAGYEGAIAAGKKGLKTALIEKDSLGGTCLQKGCIPTKNLLNSVKTLKYIKNSKKIGIKIENYSIDINVLKKNKDRVIEKLTRGIEFLLNKYNIKLYKGIGRIMDNNTLLINDSVSIKTKHIVIATGSEPAILPSIKFDNKYIINSDQALELLDVPAGLLVIGAGPIGLEMAQIYQYLGSKVTIVEILDFILPGEDRELSEILKSELKKQGIKIHTSTSAYDPVINDRENNVSLNFSTGDKVWTDTFSKVLIAVGRKPNTAGLTSPALKIACDSRGFLKVNNNLQTNMPNIFACGDVIGGQLLAHKASHQAMQIVDFIHRNKPLRHHPVPAAVFTFPEFSSVGLSEEQANEKGLDIKIGRFPYSAGSKSNAIDEKAGLVKVIADKNETIIGAHIVGAQASELIQLLNYAILKKLRTADFQELVTIHPTLSENVWEAMGEITGFSIHL